MAAKFSLRRKLSLMLIVLTVIPLVGLSVLLYSRANEIIMEDITKHTQDVLALVTGEIRSELNDGIRTSDLLVYDDSFMAMLEELRANPDADLQGKFGGQMGDLVRTALASQISIRSIALFSGDRTFTYSVPEETRAVLEMQKKFIRGYANRGRGKNVYSVVPGLNDYVAICRMFYRHEYFDELATLVILVPIAHITGPLGTHLGEYGRFFTLMERGSFSRIIQTVEGVQYLGPFVRQKPGIEMQAPTVYYDKLDRRLISYRDMATPEWRAVLVIPEEIVFARAFSMRNWMVFFTCIAVAIAGGVSYLIARNIVSPLLVLVRAMKQMEESPNRMQLPETRKDEIGYLFGAYNRMADKLDHLINMVYREQVVRKDTELRALQAQINPHFLFNTLDTINWQARLEGAPVAGSMITTLSDMLHLNIGREGRDRVTLSDELHYLENYLYLQRIRYEDRIVFECAVDKVLLELTVPCLILQPIAENAIFHNAPFERLALRLSSRIEDGYAYLDMEDTGKGIEPGILSDLRKRLNGENGEGPDADLSGLKSVGLSNVHRRLSLNFGAPCGLSISSVQGEKTTVTLKIPYSSCFDEEEEDV